MISTLWGNCTVELEASFATTSEGFVSLHQDVAIGVACPLSLPASLASSEDVGLILHVDLTRLGVAPTSPDLLLEIVVLAGDENVYYSGRRFTKDDLRCPHTFSLAAPCHQPLKIGVLAAQPPESGNIRLTVSDIQPARVKSVRRLTNEYASFLENGWWPDKFQDKLHQVCEIVGRGALRSGGDAIDLGANRGQNLEAIVRTHKGKSGKIVAVEANPLVFQALVENFSENRDAVIFENKAIVPKLETGDSVSIDFFISEKHTELGSIDKDYIQKYFGQLDPKDFHAVAVPATTLDSLIHAHAVSQLRFLKVDIEGIDIQVLLESDRVWSSGAVIYFEYNYDVVRPFELQFFRKASRSFYRIYDCFLNELDECTWRFPTICPIDRIALPVDFPAEQIERMRREIRALFKDARVIDDEITCAKKKIGAAVMENFVLMNSSWLSLPWAHGLTLNDQSPLPDFRNRARIAGFDLQKPDPDPTASFFLSEGFSQIANIKRLYELCAGAGSFEHARILDWGVGCGRLIRHMPVANRNNVYGADIDRINIEWLTQNMAFGSYVLVQPSTPMPVEDDFFDLVYSISVMTHLAEDEQFFWLQELNRICRGLMILSVHGPVSVSKVDGWRQDPLSFLSWLDKGYINASSPNPDIADAVDPEYYRDTAHTPRYIHENWSRYVDIIDIIPGGLSPQRNDPPHDLVICKAKRPR